MRICSKKVKLPFCEFCKENRVKRITNRFCSRECARASKRGVPHSEERRKKIGLSVKKHWAENYETRILGAKKAAITRILTGNPRSKHTEETKRKISETERGKKVSKSTRHKQHVARKSFVKKNPELVRENSARAGIQSKGRKQAKHVVDAIKKCWQDPVYKAKRLKAMLKFSAPNKLEKKVISIMKVNKLNYKFVGNGKLIVGGFNPDFVHKKKKLLIEVFGDYWHNRKDWKKRDKRRLKTFKKYGYKTLILWEKDIHNNPEFWIVNEVKSFEKGY